MARSNNSPHILGTSANLLGMCFIVLTSLNVMQVSEKTLMDEVVSVAIFFFMTSSLLSFLSMRNKENTRMETMADYFFLGGLLLLFVTSCFLVFNFF